MRVDAFTSKLELPPSDANGSSPAQRLFDAGHHFAKQRQEFAAHPLAGCKHLFVIDLAGDNPAAMLVTQEIASTPIPMWRATITSGTVDMPTRSAPIARR